LLSSSRLCLGLTIASVLKLIKTKNPRTTLELARVFFPNQAKAHYDTLLTSSRLCLGLNIASVLNCLKKLVQE